MSKKLTKKSLRTSLEAQLSDLAHQTDELRKQVVDKAPGVRDQIVDQGTELRKQVVDRAPGVRDQIVAALPDKGQLLDLRDDLFDRLPENVQERLPEKVKPKRSKLKKVALAGIVAGAGAAAFSVLKRKGAEGQSYTPPTPPAPPVPPVAPAAAGTADAPTS